LARPGQSAADNIGPGGGGAMDNAIARTPIHLWIVGGAATLYNAFGGYLYWKARSRDVPFLQKSAPDADPQAVIGYMDSFPIWASFGWGLGVWAALVGSLLLVARSRHAVLVFLLSLVGMALSFGYQATGPAKPAGMDGGAGQYVPLLIIAIGVALFLYARAMRVKGVLR